MAAPVAARVGRRYAGIVESIGDTPTIEIPRLAPSPDVRLFAKLEAANPTGSIKDRVARALIEDLEAKGRLQPGSIILEATSGNTGIALAMIGRRKGYRVAVVMPDNVTLERRQLVALHGAEVIDSPGALGSNGAIALARELVARDPQFVMADQYANPANPRVHEETTGPEILDAVPELDREPLARLLPGPYTLVLPNPAHRFPWLTGGEPGPIGVRVPVLPEATRAIVAELGVVLATSANDPGGPNPVSLDDVPRRIRAGCGAELDLGPLPGTPSTVVDLSGPKPRILREGAVPAAEALDRLGA